jgi:hypothetical protein
MSFCCVLLVEISAFSAGLTGGRSKFPSLIAHWSRDVSLTLRISSSSSSSSSSSF